ncbi:MAG: cation diffusion facilitator family transporter [Planctomycetota bacterium]|jgi:cation diffusion facilitator family transporter
MIIKVDEKCRKCADRAMWVGLAGNVFLCLFKGIIGFISGSLAVVADALHSGADVLVSVVAIITVYLAKKPADQTHPYGHGKTEFMGGVFVGIILLIGAAFIVVSSIAHLLRGFHQPPPHFIALAAAAISIAVNESLYRWIICAARRVNSAALEAEGWDNRSDAFSSVPVFLGVLGAQFGFRSLDPLAALFVGILVGKIAFELLSKNLHGLMDMPLHSTEIKRIKELVVATPGVRNIGYLRTRGMGRHYLADLQILVDPKTTVEKSNAIAAKIRNALRREIKHLEDITIACKGSTKKRKPQKQ